MIENKIMKLQNYYTFWEDVKKIVGYYENIHHEDKVIKELQRIADKKYQELEE